MTKKSSSHNYREATYLNEYLKKFVAEEAEKKGVSKSAVIANCIEAVKKGSTQSK